ncbi:MAG TPA: sensor histidine kinase, partial [Flavitalea sp.]|nr:sensor histidine kinase [Flavitalea sp.]
LLNNLITNAIRYSPSNQPLFITLVNNKLSIKNQGAGRLNHDKLFKRFASGSSESPGTGLGLAIVKQISTRYGWEVSYNYINESHVFSADFQD